MTESRKITIDPISRLEGHGKVTIHLDEKGEVEKALFHVTQFRGYEKFCEGRPFEEMPIITQRICGICPVSHQLASAKACDAILGIAIPETARLLRELEHLGQYIQSHALHFFYLASPDLLLGWDAEPAKRNVVGVIGAFPELAGKGIRLRRFGQEIIKALGGKKVHPAYAVPGGVINPLEEKDRDSLLPGFSEAFSTALIALDLIRGWVEKNKDEVKRFANFASNYAGLVDQKGFLDLYDGKLRVAGSDGQVLAEFNPGDYLGFIGEHVEPWSYMKFPYYKPQGYPQGAYRVGPLARLNAVSGISTAQAGVEWTQFRETAGVFKGGILLYHYARLVELLYCLEKAEQIMKDDRICRREVRLIGKPVHEEGVGIIEAPRGTLIHHYAVDKHGAIRKANLIVATGHNNIAMNQSVTLVAREFIRGGNVKEGFLNRVEGAIRCYDPCLSCATHAVGSMPLRVELLDPQGRLVQEMVKS